MHFLKKIIIKSIIKFTKLCPKFVKVVGALVAGFCVDDELFPNALETSVNDEGSAVVVV